MAIYRPEAGDEEGIKGGAELIVEVRSPGDEAYDKLPWYLAQRCREVLIVDRDTLRVELFTANGRVDPDDTGFVMINALGLRIGPVSGGSSLTVEGSEGSSQVTFRG